MPPDYTGNIYRTLEQEEIERLTQSKVIPDFAPGDSVLVNVNVVEGSRKRLQAFEGVVIGRRNRGLNSSFIVRKISSGESVERTFQLYSEYNWKVRSTDSPEEILRTIKEEFSPRLRRPITTPSNACSLFLLPSTTLTLTKTLSPGAKSGMTFDWVRRSISSCSKVSIIFTV